ncbi:Helix-turn-helix domain protein [Pseudoalteromonas sp. NC201]|nr:Helix-turn-helix domain protein [Pseudoalteromonas sp. NC201]
MNHYEKGRHTPDLQTLKRIAEELGVPLNYFFCENDEMAKFVILFEKLPQKEKEALLTALETKQRT